MERKFINIYFQTKNYTVGGVYINTITSLVKSYEIGCDGTESEIYKKVIGTNYYPMMGKSLFGYRIEDESTSNYLITNHTSTNTSTPVYARSKKLSLEPTYINIFYCRPCYNKEQVRFYDFRCIRNIKAKTEVLAVSILKAIRNTKLYPLLSKQRLEERCDLGGYYAELSSNKLELYNSNYWE